ncbi:MAG: spore coat associated protein CotJA [Eubacteriales bacterium]|nr:spore coat associated protein CotJA [Eubacteriales bacterium]
MDCSNNQRSACIRRPQLQPAACQSGLLQPGRPLFFSGMEQDGLAGMPAAMAYTPMQRWGQTYALSQGFQRGTIFPELDLPFMMGRCRG